jgi:hypothetical protein
VALAGGGVGVTRSSGKELGRRACSFRRWDSDNETRKEDLCGRRRLCIEPTANFLRLIGQLIGIIFLLNNFKIIKNLKCSHVCA